MRGRQHFLWRSNNRSRLAMGINVADPILTISTSPSWISSYSLDRPMPVIFTAIAIRTLSGAMT